jgi:hypothetical protein
MVGMEVPSPRSENMGVFADKRQELANELGFIGRHVAVWMVESDNVLRRNSQPRQGVSLL